MTRPHKQYQPDGSWLYDDEEPTDEEWCEDNGIIPEAPREEDQEMPTPKTRLIPITDTTGRLLLPADDLYEPLPGSVVLTEGLHGTAWQRFFSDGRWHPTRGGGSKDWTELLRKRNLVLVYDADQRVSGRVG